MRHTSMPVLRVRTCVAALLVAMGVAPAFGCGDSAPASSARPNDVDGAPDGAVPAATNDAAPGADGTDAEPGPGPGIDASTPGSDAGARDGGTPPSNDAGLAAHPLALVYRGDDEAGCAGCSEAVQALLESSKYAFEVKFVGPKETLKIDAATLSKAVLYAQPGGNGTVDKGWKYLKSAAPALRAFVQNGGRYLGFCMGGYFAGKDPGFDLLPGDTAQWIASKGASVTTDDDALVKVLWRGKERTLYFQDGPHFVVDTNAPGVTVLATYASNNKIAAVVAPLGKGKVGVTGPHPEADSSWYKLAKLKDPDGLDADLGRDLVETTME